MDWNQLARFVLLGNSDWQQYAILLVRISLGLFFAITGANKLFVAKRTEAMYDTLVKTGVPFPRPMTYFVSTVEFLGGCLVAIGLLSSLASLALLVNMLVAVVTAKLPAMRKELSPWDRLDNFLYLPEVLYILFFVWLICSGPGRFSLDFWLARKL